MTVASVQAAATAVLTVEILGLNVWDHSALTPAIRA